MKAEVKSILRAFYQGGTKLQAHTTHTPSDLRSKIESARKEMRDVEINCVSEDATIESENIYLCRTGLLFYTILTPVSEIAKSDIIIAPAGTIK